MYYFFTISNIYYLSLFEELIISQLCKVLLQRNIKLKLKKADEGNSAYCQSSGAHNIKHI